MHDGTEFSTLLTFVFSKATDAILPQSPENIDSVWTRVNLTGQHVRVTLNHYKKDLYFALYILHFTSAQSGIIKTGKLQMCAFVDKMTEMQK